MKLFKTPILQIFSIQVKEFIRDPGVLFWALGFPLLMTVVLGGAFSGEGSRGYTIAVVLDDRSTPQLEDSLRDVDRDQFRIQFVKTKNEANRLMQKGRISFYITGGVKIDEFQYSFDPVNEQSHLAYMIFKKQLQNDGEEDIIALKATGQRYIDFLIPGLLAMGIMNAALWGSGWTLIEYRMKKLLRRMSATPMRKWEFFFGHILTRLLLSSLEFSFLWIFASFMFDLPFSGSVTELLIVFLAGNFAFNGIAIGIGSRTDNSRIGNGLINAVSIPMMLLSGIFFSYENFPSWAVEVIRYLPLTLLTDSLRAIFLEGVGIEEVLVPSAILFATGGATFLAGLKLFRWS